MAQIALACDILHFILAQVNLNYSIQVILVHNVCHSGGISFDVIGLCETLSA